ncbi:putative DNA-repair protein XRCC4 [Zostera marina]|uniref:Putative DNA-repair protein XRCC4 n=1 Tax=Zostera marina TaxID=29655 RepID=A0A0K9NND8_ZOSMR|nr:putative DNA-repair protein XRCC4 [Zostera marina]
MVDDCRHTCLRLDIVDDDPESKDIIFVKGSWFPSHFDLYITNGLHAWSCHGSEEEVKKRARLWDQSIALYIETAESYLGFQQSGSVYRFEDIGDRQRRFSFTFEKQGVTLQWRWKCQPSCNEKQLTFTVLDFLMESNIRLSDEVIRKTQSIEKLKIEAEKCLDQSERFRNEKVEFEQVAFSKFVSLLNSKKAKLRELRDKIAKLETSGKHTEDENSSL